MNPLQYLTPPKYINVGNLYDLCHDYIEDAHFESSNANSNEKIYGLCCDYIIGVTTESQEETLINHFSPQLKK